MRSARIVGIVAILALFAGGPVNADRPRSSHAAAVQTPDEADLISAYPHLIRRQEGILWVERMPFTNEGDCQEGACDYYRADGVWKGKHVGVDARYHEGRDYFLVTGNYAEPIGSRPISSPSGTRFFTGHQSYHGWTPYEGASVWEWEPQPSRLRIVDTHLVTFEEFVAWRGDGCVEFRGTRGLPSDETEVRNFWLAEQNGDWQLLENRPKTCNSAEEPAEEVRLEPY